MRTILIFILINSGFLPGNRLFFKSLQNKCLGYACIGSAPRTQTAYAPAYQYQAVNYQQPAVARGAESLPSNPLVSQAEGQFFKNGIFNIAAF